MASPVTRRDVWYRCGRQPVRHHGLKTLSLRKNAPFDPDVEVSVERDRFAPDDPSVCAGPLSPPMSSANMPRRWPSGRSMRRNARGDRDVTHHLSKRHAERLGSLPLADRNRLDARAKHFRKNDCMGSARFRSVSPGFAGPPAGWSTSTWRSSCRIRERERAPKKSFHNRLLPCKQPPAPPPQIRRTNRRMTPILPLRAPDLPCCASRRRRSYCGASPSRCTGCVSFRLFARRDACT
ncbi:hypothetical protein QFZ97_008494 [Paraburkholderia youngii]